MSEELQEMLAIAGDSEIKVMLEKILIDALAKGVSDIHITADAPVYLRDKGEMVPCQKIYTAEEVEEMAKILAGKNYDRFVRERQLDTAYQLSNGRRFRVNIYYQLYKVSITMRVIAHIVPTMQKLNMPSVFKDIISYKNGLILVTGATGSGKSTTLAALVNEINETKQHKIVTLEDPIEFVFENKKSLITQREVGEDVLSFADGLKAILRQDPDVIVAGELRDMETIELALTAAETGHLVLATLHTNSAISSIERVTSVFPSEQQEQVKLQMSKSLRAVCSQYLVPTKAGSRVCAMEILINTKAIANLIREGKLTQIPNMMKMGRNEGMMVMNDALDILVTRGTIDKEVAEGYKIK